MTTPLSPVQKRPAIPAKYRYRRAVRRTALGWAFCRLIGYAAYKYMPMKLGFLAGMMFAAAWQSILQWMIAP